MKNVPVPVVVGRARAVRPPLGLMEPLGCHVLMTGRPVEVPVPVIVLKQSPQEI